MLGGVSEESEGKIQIGSLYTADPMSGAVDIQWKLGPEIPVVTGSAVASYINGKVCKQQCLPLHAIAYLSTCEE